MKGLLIALALISTAAAISRDVQWEAFKLKFKKVKRVNKNGDNCRMSHIKLDKVISGPPAGKNSRQDQN